MVEFTSEKTISLVETGPGSTIRAAPASHLASGDSQQLFLSVGKTTMETAPVVNETCVSRLTFKEMQAAQTILTLRGGPTPSDDVTTRVLQLDEGETSQWEKRIAINECQMNRAEVHSSHFHLRNHHPCHCHRYFNPKEMKKSDFY